MTRGGFTLVELLVVAACLTVLSAVLLPAIAAVRPHSQNIICANNLKQLTLAEIMYCDANTHSIPDTTVDGMTGGWFINLQDYFGGGTNAMMMCPAASQPVVPSGSTLSVGTATAPWGRIDSFGNNAAYFGSYAFNGWLFTKRSDANSGDGDGVSELGTSAYYLTGNSVRFPARTPVFTDGFWVDGWPTETDAACHDTRGVGGFNSPNLGTGSAHHEMARFAMARHGCDPFASNVWQDPTKTPPGEVNVGLFDGHVELSNFPNLWRYQWHNNWRQTLVFIGTPY